MNEIFGSRLSSCKLPFGAVRTGENIAFHIYPKRTLGVSRAFLVVTKDGDVAKRYSLSWRCLKDDRDVYYVNYHADSCGLFWYHFLLETASGEQIINKTEGGYGELSESVKSEFQLTVSAFEGNFPSWFGEGITYQIFPDRFFRSAEPKQDGYKNYREIHENWDELPDYLPNDKGEILNNDFFGGNFEGIIKKLSYLKSLNVTTVYLNPIFEASSNHRYDTGDYLTTDSMLGSVDDFKKLCEEAEKLDIRIILDGVFSHTGYDSRYFNAKGHYDSIGAFNSKESPYFEWYSFDEWPNKYSSWWGFYTLPEVNELNTKYLDFMTDGETAVVPNWIKMGASGCRLDVADELPDEFIKHVTASAKKAKSDAVIIGEVWEDASNKISYGVRRRYFHGNELDSVMNYPFRDAVIAFLKGGKAENFIETMETIRENYPKEVFMNLMNSLGTHDTARILTLLGASKEDFQKDKKYKSKYYLDVDSYKKAKNKLFMAVVMQFTMPGSPCIYYGDEVGMQGFEDPFNRKTFPWGHEDKEIFDFFKKVSDIRNVSDALKKGNIRYLLGKDGIIVYKRSYSGENIVVAVNRESYAQAVEILFSKAENLLTGEIFENSEKLKLGISGESAEIFRCI